MAVFTRITHEDLQHWLAGRACGTLQSFEGISSGIENTNYFVNTTTGRYVLTIFEKLTEADLPFYLGLMQHLAGKGLPVPGPVAGRQGELFNPLMGKPATLVNCLAGQSVDAPSAVQCGHIGEFSAKAHQAVVDFAGNTPNPRGLDWIKQSALTLKPHIPADKLNLLEDEVAHQSAIAQSAAYLALPRGAVHADLFRDNALMQGEQLGGVIDFYFAGVDTFLFDLAVTANDWCINHITGEFKQDQLEALVTGYAKHRPFTEDDQALWPHLLRAAALRFWTSRMMDYYMPRKAEVLNVKDPAHFERILLDRRQRAYPALPRG